MLVKAEKREAMQAAFKPDASEIKKNPGVGVFRSCDDAAVRNRFAEMLR